MKTLVILLTVIVIASPSPQGNGFWWQKESTFKKEEETDPRIVNPNPNEGDQYINPNEGDQYINPNEGDQYINDEYCTYGKCTPYYRCNEESIVESPDGAGIIDIRYLGGSDTGSNTGGNTGNAKLAGGECPNLLDVCCTSPLPTEPIDPPKPLPPDYPPEEPIYHPTCGRNSKEDLGPPAIDIRIHLDKTRHGFDNVAQFGRYPWMSAILEVQDSPNGLVNVYQCGGSLIHKRFVLTAAHCVYKYENDPTHLRVRLGEWNTNTEKDHPTLTHEDYEVQHVIIHKNYLDYKKNLHDGIALLYLTKPVKTDYHINTICLPDPHSSKNFVGKILPCNATGWGKDNFGKIGVYQSILKEIDIPIRDFHECNAKLQSTRLGCRFCLHDSFLCAGGIPGKDTCEGDGGSPLVCYDDYKKDIVQLGIVAWGIGCGTDVPGVYIDVSRYTRWIEDNINYYLPGTYTTDWGNIPYKYEGQPEYKACRDHAGQRCGYRYQG